MRLSPSMYDLLQRLVHGDYEHVVKSIIEDLCLNPGGRVVEIGCGTGRLAGPFLRSGMEYWGLDPDAGRIALARAENPDGNFLVGDAGRLGEADLPEFNCAFVHGVVHHLDDKTTLDMLEHLISLPNMRAVIIDPILPKRPLSNPFGYLLAKMDEGNYVRTGEDLEELFSPYVISKRTRSLMPRWPVPFMHLTLELNE